VPTLYVENVPEDLYEALRDRAKQNRKSISAEVISLLESNVPTAAELKRRLGLIERTRELRSHRSPGRGPFPSAVEMLREDRER
jgi:plasmid stability protein